MTLERPESHDSNERWVNFAREAARVLNMKYEELNFATHIDARHLDSLGATEIVFAAEEILSVAISFEDLRRLKRYEDLVRLLCGKGAK